MSVNFAILVVIASALGAGLAFGGFGLKLSAFLFIMAGWIIAVCLHEWGHAIVAYHGGDRSVRDKGYLTLDPIKYTNPLTSIVFPLAILAVGGIGFPGGAVYINMGALNGRLWKSAVSLAGPAMTGVAMLALGAPFAFGWVTAESPFGASLALLCFLQATAMLLNLLPLPGLDGWGVLEPFLPRAFLDAIAPVRTLGLYVILFVFLLAPEALAPLFRGALALASMLGVSGEAIGAGFDAFRFWL